ncbi:MAG: hypothetical protein H7A51_13555 [Akkermansiaceae bacterium]|nr:hypothetical protein [Akkermansiaceae bacterium]
MPRILRISVVDPDPDYLGIEIYAASERYAGSTRIYTSEDELSEFGRVIEGFPSAASDTRNYVLGTEEDGFAGGYIEFRFYCTDGAGHAAIGIRMTDDMNRNYTEASASFSFAVTPAEIDTFVAGLMRVAAARSGCVELE